MNGSLYMKFYTVASFIFKKGGVARGIIIFGSWHLKRSKISSQHAALDILMNSIFSWEIDILEDLEHLSLNMFAQWVAGWRVGWSRGAEWPSLQFSIMIEDMCCFRNISRNTHLIWYFVKYWMYFISSPQSSCESSHSLEKAALVQRVVIADGHVNKNRKYT